MRVGRYDAAATLKPPRRMDNGFVSVEGRIARVGIQEYRRADGSIHRELRLPEEVFNADSLASFHCLPVTNQHPPGMLTAKNAKRFQVGSVGESVRQDGDYVAATMMITDADAIDAMERGRSQLSNGYSCELDETQDPALIARWGKYDSIQRRIRGNHVALVDVGRAGPEASVRLDSNDAIAVDCESSVIDDNETERMTMPIKFKIDGFDVEVADGNTQSVIERAIEKARQDGLEKARQEKERADKAVLDLTQASARADVAESENKELKAKAEKDQAARSDEFKTLLALGAEVSKLGVDVSKCDHSEIAYKTAAVKKLRPALNLDGKGAEYIAAVYDIAKSEQPSAVDQARAGLGENASHVDAVDSSADAARRRYNDRLFGKAK